MSTHDIGLFKLRSVQLPENTYNSFFYLNQVDLPNKGISGGSDVVALQLRYGCDLERYHFTSLGPFLAQIPRSYIGASPVVLQRLGLKDEDEVFVSLCRANSLSVVAVRPESSDDYNILANMQDLMENVMLYQVRIVAPRQQLPLKIGNIIIDLVVENVKPKEECGRLEQFTEVIVMDPDDEVTSESALVTHSASQLSVTDLVWRFFKWGTQFWDYSRDNPDEEKSITRTRSTKEILNEAFKQKANKAVEYRVIPEKKSSGNLEVIYTSYGCKTYAETPCKITKLPERTEINASDSSKKQDCHIHCLVSSRDTEPGKDLEIYMPKALMKRMGLYIGSRVFVEKVASLPKDAETVRTLEDESKEEGKKIFHLWSSMEEIRRRVVKAAEISNALITGPSGCGKTVILKTLAQNFTDQNRYCSVVNCKTLRGKKIESLLKVLTSKWSECAYREPSVLFLDDLDALMYLNEEEDPESGMSGAYCKRVGALLTELEQSFQKIGKISLIATASSVASLGPGLASSRGPRLFGMVLQIPEMSAEEREEVLTRFGASVNQELVKKTHGYRVQDLVDLVSRARLRALVDNRTELTDKDFQAALNDTVPMALQGVQLQTDIPYTWSDVGGMEDVKKALDEIFRWPSQYPDVFASCPLRLQTGALVYGPPGCGKTLIAGALASQCGMNFRSVKGPELLSKYVGASEGAVRSLFEAAQQARPCLLFFDELDSLAPRRGTDSTGVTDRVVNQLLTELDGVEGRLGVWVLGASSRPDLIDPALLRPGRLDRAIYCPVPIPEERLQILQVQSRGLSLADDVSLTDWVAKTVGFTGADLKALLYNSYMKAVQEESDVDESELKVATRHLEAALTETKSSLSNSEKRRYELIFKRFQAAKASKKTPVTMTDQQQKVTFA